VYNIYLRNKAFRLGLRTIKTKYLTYSLKFTQHICNNLVIDIVWLATLRTYTSSHALTQYSADWRRNICFTYFVLRSAAIREWLRPSDSLETRMRLGCLVDEFKDWWLDLQTNLLVISVTVIGKNSSWARWIVRGRHVIQVWLNWLISGAVDEVSKLDFL
jgi:hypothetical protein